MAARSHPPSRRRTSSSTGWLLASALGAVTLGTAAVQGATIYSDPADGAIYRLFAGGGGVFNAQDLIAGKTDNASYNGIALFQLPDRQGLPLAAATLSLAVGTGGTVGYANLDIWGLGYVHTAAASASWILTADTDARTGTTLGTNLGLATPTKIADNFLASGVASGGPGTLFQTNTPQNATLLAFLNSLYESYGAVAGDFAVIRINPDSEIVDGTFQNVRFGGSHQTSPDRRAVLNVTVVPEPTSTALLILAGVAFAGRRRRAAASV